MKSALFTIALLLAPVAAPVYAQVGQDLKQAGHDSKTAAKEGADKTGHAVKKGATKSTHATKKGIHKTATKVSDKTQDTNPK